jgi:hypothetical protein
MARFDRCSICDYDQATGSALTGVNPNANGKVRRYNEDQLCDKCASEINKAHFDLKPPEEIDEELQEE